MTEAAAGGTLHDDFTVELGEAAGVPVVRAAGEIDVATAPRLAEVLGQVPVEASVVVVDLSGVTFIDSTGIGVLVAGWKQVREAHPQGEVRLVVTRPHIVKVLEITGLDDVFGVYAAVVDAAGVQGADG